MKKIFNATILFFALIAAFNANAQTSNWMGKNVAGAIQIGGTYRNTDLGQINSALNANGIPSLSGNDFWINASMMHVHKKVIFEDGIGFTPTSSSSNNNGLKAKLNQAQLFARIGYDIADGPNYRFFPFAGVNFTGAMLAIQDKNRINATNDFSTELLNSTSSKTFYQGNFGIDLGLGFDYAIPIKAKTVDCFTIKRSIPIGIRGGYYINAAHSDWHVDDHSLNGANKSQSAVFLSLAIGLGYEISK